MLLFRASTQSSAAVIMLLHRLIQPRRKLPFTLLSPHVLPQQLPQSSTMSLYNGMRSLHQSLPLFWADKEGVKLVKAIKTSHYEENKQIIARLLAISPDQVQKKLPKKLINEESAAETVKILQECKFGTGQILEHPDLFMMTSTSIQNYIEIMKESCFTDIRQKMIANFRNVHKQTLRTLKDNGIVPEYPEIIKKYCNLLHITNTKTEDQIWNILPKEIDRLTLLELRKHIMGQYLSLKLDVTQEEVDKIFTKYPRLEFRCLKSVRDNFTCLLNDLEFPIDKIKKHAYLLHANTTNTLKIIQEIKTLSEIPLKQLVHSRPKILMSLCSSLIEIESIFQEHDITPEAVSKYPEIYTLSPATVKERLEEMDQIPEFRSLKNNPRVARLMYYQNKAKSRIEYLRSVQMTGASLHLLSSDTKRFKEIMALGEMKTRGCDTVGFISEYLGPQWTLREIRDNLMRQPHWLNCSLVKMKESLQFIDSFGVFSKQQIFSALPILVYPTEKIKKEFQSVVESKDAKISDEYFLHMVLYFLERAVHFSGDGVWTIRHDIHEDDDDQDHSQESQTLDGDEEHSEIKISDQKRRFDALK